MATRADVARLQAAHRGVVALATRDLQAFWASLNLDKPEAARDALVRFVPVLVERYGEVAAGVAADWYDDLRAASAVAPGYRAAIADGFPAQAVAQNTRFGARHLFTEQPATALDFLKVAVSRYALQPGRNTLIESAARDPWKPRWARVPSGSKTCAFCLMLASRGPVYLSAANAGEMVKFHGDCDCAVTPIWPQDELPDGYDPDALYAQYQEARQVAESTSTRDILAALRQEQGTH